MLNFMVLPGRPLGLARHGGSPSSTSAWREELLEKLWRMALVYLINSLNAFGFENYFS